MSIGVEGFRGSAPSRITFMDAVLAAADEMADAARESQAAIFRDDLRRSSQALTRFANARTRLWQTVRDYEREMEAANA